MAKLRCIDWVSLGWCTVWLAALLILLFATWQQWLSLRLTTYQTYRNRFAIGIVIFAVWTLYRVASAVYHGEAKSDTFRPELIGYTVFWVLFPPLWFFLSTTPSILALCSYPLAQIERHC